MHLRDDGPSLFSLVRFARAMRKAPTRSEALLWAQLKKRKVSGARFRRQHPLDRYIVVSVPRTAFMKSRGDSRTDRVDGNGSA